jgi:hypothetical protein
VKDPQFELLLCDEDMEFVLPALSDDKHDVGKNQAAGDTAATEAFSGIDGYFFADLEAPKDETLEGSEGVPK